MISSRFILTATHCLLGEEAEGMDVFLGSIHRDGQGGERYDVLRNIVHNEYNRYTTENDIGLVHVSFIEKFNKIDDFSNDYKYFLIHS